MRNARKVIAAAAAVGIIAVGSGTAFRNVRTEAFQTGMSAMEDGNYALAAENLERAIRLGERSKEVALNYSEAAMKIGKYEEAVKVLEKQKSPDRKMMIDLRECCSRIADEALNRTQKDKAEEYLRKSLDLTNDHDAKVRLEALQKGSYTEDGITYNEYGDPTSIQRRDCSAELAYEHRKLSKVTVNSETYSDFTITDEHVFYEISYSPEDGLIIEKIVKEDGFPVKCEKTDKNGTTVTRYSWHDNGNGRLTSISWWSLLDDDSGSWNLTYEDGRPISADHTVRGQSDGRFRKFGYDEKGRLSTVVSYEDLIHQIETRTFVYNEEDAVVSMTVETPSSYYEYTFSDDDKKADILNGDGEVTGLLIPIGYGNVITLRDIC